MQKATSQSKFAMTLAESFLVWQGLKIFYLENFENLNLFNNSFKHFILFITSNDILWQFFCRDLLKLNAHDFLKFWQNKIWQMDNMTKKIKKNVLLIKNILTIYILK